MTKTVINFRVDQETKDQAKSVAKELGVSLSTIINSQLRQLIRHQSFETSNEPSSSKLEAILTEIVATKRTSKRSKSREVAPSTIQADRLRFGYKQYTSALASYWDKVIDWPKRQAKQAHFYSYVLKKYDVQTVLDIACGSGFDSLNLLKAGFKVKSVDGSLPMLIKAQLNAEDQGLSIDSRCCDWRRLRNNFKASFDGAVCLGDSFSHLFETQDRSEVIKQVASLLPNGGVFIVDQRNYDRLLDKGLSSKPDYLYAGASNVKVLAKSQNYVRLAYELNNSQFSIEVYPIRYKELRDLLREAGFEVISYGDYRSKFTKYGPEFFQHVCIKR